ncbi:cytochrome P450 [Annulohypoxylon moriforme]|nr:cytochrome P450 [Annulohypoxylon moriforme]
MLHEIFWDLPSPVNGFLLIACLLLSWRLWTFTLKPWLWPSRPRELPYWAPFIGHTFSFFRNYVELMEAGLNSIGRRREPYSIQLLGQKLYICTASADVSIIFDDTVGFNFDSHLTNLLTSFGISADALKRAWHEPKPGDWCYIPNNPLNPKQKCLIHCVEDIYKQQLLPGSRMDEWCRTFLDSVQTSLCGIESLDFCTTQFEGCVWCGDCAPRYVSLYKLVAFFNIQATTRAMFGSHLHDIDPSVVEHMLAFNEHVWMVVFRCPNVMGLPIDEPRRKLMAIMRKFVRLPKSTRSQASWAITSVLDGMETVDMDMESRASMILMIFWAAVSNEHNSCYWLLTHLLYDASLFKLIREETEAAWQSGQLDVKYLCSNCPNLDATFNEVLRLNNTAAAVRVATHETIVGGKVLKKGSMIVMPFRQLHTDENVWGSDVSQFSPTRFLKNKSWARHPSFRPFGGGATLCPGQTLARQEVFGFIAILIHRFHLSLPSKSPKGEKPPFPCLNSMTPSFGLNGPIKGTDIFVGVAEVKR